jgi:hypothetical protein
MYFLIAIRLFVLNFEKFKSLQKKCKSRGINTNMMDGWILL